jgi:DNA-binding response OmpR family regulator
MSNVFRIALVEPHAPDARWFRMALEEADIAVDVVHYATGLKALARWRADRPTYDLIIVSDLLPMLTSDEFITDALALVPAAVVYIACESHATTTANINVLHCHKPFTRDVLRAMLMRLSRRNVA